MLGKTSLSLTRGDNAFSEEPFRFFLFYHRTMIIFFRRQKQFPPVERFDEKLYNVLEDVGSVNVGDFPLLSFHGLLT